MREFFGFSKLGGGYNRTPEGYMSWQHIVFVVACMLIMIGLAIFIGIKNRNKDIKSKNKVLIWAAVLIDGFEIFKIILLCIRSQNAMQWVIMLPLFLCSIQLIAIPIAAFAKGRVKEAALDFVLIFGILGAVLGTFAAAQNYNAYPVLSFDNVVSAITHCISGFASLYIAISKMASMKLKNSWITCCILLVFCIAAYIANISIDYNYMFLMRGDGTPYDYIYNFVGGSPVLYPILVVVLFYLYIFCFYLIWYLIVKAKNKKETKTN